MESSTVAVILGTLQAVQTGQDATRREISEFQAKASAWHTEEVTETAVLKAQVSAIDGEDGRLAKLEKAVEKLTNQRNWSVGFCACLSLVFAFIGWLLRDFPSKWWRL